MKKILFLLTIFIFISCSNDDDFSSPVNEEVETPETPNPETPTIDLSQNFGTEVSRDFIGQIIDVDHNPIQDASIHIGNSSLNTDENGIFIMKDANVYENFAYITASKTGYINGSRALVPTEGTNNITIMLLEKNTIATVNSESEETVSLPNGASVDLNGNYQDGEGNAYSGSVNVSMHHLNPEDEDMLNQMPGMLYAANAQNEERMLQTFGMLAVELEGENGESLNLAEGSIATIHIPLSQELLATAPSSIPLWHFDEEKGYWIEDGEATLQGDEYIGTVSHFSFWNFDIPAEAVNYCLTVTDETDEPIANTFVSITSVNYGTTYGSTNENGEVCGLVPMGENLTLDFYNGNYNSACNNIFYSAEIGPFSQDTEETLNIEVPDELEVSVTATILNCDAEPLAEGYVIINTGDYSSNTIYIENGEFSTSFLLCNQNQTMELEAININSLESSGDLLYTLIVGSNDLGSISTCETELEEFIQYSIDNGDDFLITENITANFDDQDYSLFIQGFNNQADFYLESLLTEELTGSYNSIPYNQTGIGFSFIEMPLTTDENTNITFEVTTIGEVGQYIDINFSGDYLDWNGTPHTITGSVHVLRDE